MFIIDFKTVITLILIYILGIPYFTFYCYNKIFDTMKGPIRKISSILIGLLWPFSMIVLAIAIAIIVIAPIKTKNESDNNKSK